MASHSLGSRFEVITVADRVGSSGHLPSAAPAARQPVKQCRGMR
jgi:hypothetical protein